MKAEKEPSQDKIILDALKAQPGVPVPMPELAAMADSMNVHTRAHAINEAHGKIIWNLLVRNGRRWKSYYYYRPLSDKNKDPKFIPA